MATFTKFQPFVENLAEKAFNLGSDQLVVALCAAANAPVNTNGTLSQLTQISYTNLSSRNLTTAGSSQTSGTYKLTINDLVLTASGNVATFRYVVIYDDTAANDELIAFFDYGSDVTLASGDTFTIDFDGTNGLLQIA
jgi:hypothetical protein